MYWLPLHLFAALLIFFHTTEFFLAWRYMREELSFTSCLLSGPYCIAMACGLLEYAVEDMLFPSLKETEGALVLGLSMCVTGELVRKSAMVTAKHSFTHTLQLVRHPTNKLVIHGPYKYMRHPGYLGWLVWAVGTQVLLLNPICIAVFAVVSWQFFRRRITIEEQQLKQQFGLAYTEYAHSVPTWIPFVP